MQRARLDWTRCSIWSRATQTYDGRSPKGRGGTSPTQHAATLAPPLILPHPHPSFSKNYVLKPQREGGGNNLYGKEAAEKLMSASASERKAYILMDIIKPPELPAVLMGKEAMPIQVDATIELGVFGVFVGTADQEVLNTCPGHLVRTKAATSREIGVAAGLGFIDSPLFI